MRPSFITHTRDKKKDLEGVNCFPPLSLNWINKLFLLFGLCLSNLQQWFTKKSDLYYILFPLELRRKFKIEQTAFPSEQLYDSLALWFKHHLKTLLQCHRKRKKNAQKGTQHLSARHLFEPKINVVAFVLSEYIEDISHRVLGRKYLFAFYTVSKKSSGFMPHLHQSLSAGSWFIPTALNAATDLYLIYVLIVVYET